MYRLMSLLELSLAFYIGWKLHSLMCKINEKVTSRSDDTEDSESIEDE